MSQIQVWQPRGIKKPRHTPRLKAQGESEELFGTIIADQDFFRVKDRGMFII